MKDINIAIVGCGPKGLYGLERLLAHLRDQSIPHMVNIHVFESSGAFGSGAVYHPDQPEYLIMNVLASRVNAWHHEKPCPIVPEPLDFLSWKNNKRNGKTLYSEYPPRAVVGQYLRWVYDELKKHLPSNVRICEHPKKVEILEVSDGGVELQANGMEPLHCDYLLLATGHPQRMLTPDEEEIIRTLENHPFKQFISYPYPVDNLKTCAGAVAVKGMGLTFIDVVLALTEGRGGRFVQKGSTLEYVKSGTEPAQIYPFSRSGLWMHCRGDHAAVYTPVYFTKENIAPILALRGSIDFKSDLWPLLSQEFKLAYYQVLFSKHNLEYEVSDLDIAIAKFHIQYPDEPVFHHEDLLEPLGSEGVNTPEQVHAYQLKAMEDLIEMAEAGPDLDPLAAVGGVWPAVVEVFDEVFTAGGLSAESHLEFDLIYAPMLQRISFGPPVRNMKKMLALARAGILRLDIGPCSSVEFDEASGSHVIHSDAHNESVEVDVLIDARIPKVDSASDPGLYGNLLKSGKARPFENAGPDRQIYRPGCLQLSEHGEVIDASGRANPRIYMTGIPTTGITYDNESITPQRNDRFLKAWAQNVSQEIKKSPKSLVTHEI